MSKDKDIEHSDFIEEVAENSDFSSINSPDVLDSDESIESLLTSTNIDLPALSPDLFARLEGAMNDCINDEDLLKVEADLSALTPAVMHPESAEHLESRMDTADIELLLESLSPQSLSSQQIDKLDYAMSNAQDIIPIATPSVSEEKTNKTRSSFKFAVPAAALIALAFSFFSASPESENYASGSNLITDLEKVQANLAQPLNTTSGLAAGESRATVNNIVNASNEGIVIRDQIPHQSIRVTYEVVIQQQDENGQIYHIKKPMEKVLYIPQQTY